MYSNEKLIRSILGDQVYEALNKSIVKLGTKSVVDITELHDALKIAPKSVVAWLMKNLASMKKDGAEEFKLPWDENASMLVNKMDGDVYKGHISKEGKIVHEFDLCSIPQLAAHLLSFFELYDESPAGEHQEISAAPEANADIDKIKSQLQALESKLNALIMLAAGPAPEPVKKSQKDKLTRAIAALKKAGLAPGVPKPPRPGVHAGSQQGITQGGEHGPKTAESDFQTKPKSQTDINPHLVGGNKLSQKNGLPQQPKPPKQAKMALTLKSENLDSRCADCGEPDFIKGNYSKCICFKAMSTPEVKKSERSITLLFKSDWDEDNQIALWHSLKKVRS